LTLSAPHSSAMLNDRWDDSSDAVGTWSNFVPTTRIGMEDSANCSASKSHLNILHKYVHITVWVRTSTYRKYCWFLPVILCTVIGWHTLRKLVKETCTE